MPDGNLSENGAWRRLRDLFFVVGKNRTGTEGALTYPHGTSNAFELAFGPRGWYLKFPNSSANSTPSRVRPTTTSSSLPIVKWNSTWLYTQKPRTRVMPTTEGTTVTMMPMTRTYTRGDFLATMMQRTFAARKCRWGGVRTDTARV